MSGKSSGITGDALGGLSTAAGMTLLIATGGAAAPIAIPMILGGVGGITGANLDGWKGLGIGAGSGAAVGALPGILSMGSAALAPAAAAAGPGSTALDAGTGMVSGSPAAAGMAQGGTPLTSTTIPNATAPSGILSIGNSPLASTALNQVGNFLNKPSAPAPAPAAAPRSSAATPMAQIGPTPVRANPQAMLATYLAAVRGQSASA